MPTSPVGATNRVPSRGPRHLVVTLPQPRERGVTLMELLIVMILVALVAGVSYPSATSGLEGLRLRSAASQVVSFLDSAMAHADRGQQVVEVRISPAESAMAARSEDVSFERRLELPDGIKITAVTPPMPNPIEAQAQRRFLFYPGGGVPAIGIEITTRNGRKRMIQLDPITGFPNSRPEAK